MSEQSFEGLESGWRELRQRYLPFISDDPAWRFNREFQTDDPEQGWKIHLSATILAASTMLQKVAPFLQNCGVLFKGPSTLTELSKINSGIYYGYSQVGKAITVYPRSDQEAVFIAQRLHELTLDLPAPAIPFDRQYLPGSNVYYRYGAFKHLEIETQEGGKTSAIRTPQGDLVPDSRESWEKSALWISDPFLRAQSPQKSAQLSHEIETHESPLNTTYRVFRALSQRGKGGVYQAIDLSVRPPRFCILKEGRQHGETSLDGRDGHWGVKNEGHVLSHPELTAIGAPLVYSAFEVDSNYYLAMEFIEGETLQSALVRRQRRLTLAQAISYGTNIAEIISRLHASGLAWRDCKPSNLIVTRDGSLRPVDFEGSCPITQPDPPPWKTPDFSPPRSHTEYDGYSNGVDDDLYAIGAGLYFMLTGQAPKPVPISAIKLRRNLPGEITDLLAELLSPGPHQRFNAEIIARKLRIALANISGRRNQVKATDWRSGEARQIAGLSEGYRIVDRS
jgi:Protein kinase domain